MTPIRAIFENWLLSDHFVPKDKSMNTYLSLFNIMGFPTHRFYGPRYYRLRDDAGALDG